MKKQNKNAHVIVENLMSRNIKVSYREVPTGIQLAIHLNNKKGLLITCQKGGWFTVYHVIGRTVSEPIKVRGLTELFQTYNCLKCA